jgi:DNA-directed RNA polymerase specialized sigma24 family protein
VTDLPPEPDDRALVAAHLAGDTEAFGTLFGRHRNRLWAVALRTTGDPEEAADALQDALVAEVRRADSYHGAAAVTTPRHPSALTARPDPPRRVRARYRLGHARADLAALSGLSKASISLLAEGRWKVLDNKAATALANAYRQLAHRRGSNWKNERRAAAEGWHGPLAWDDIDNPDEQPETDGVVLATRRPKAPIDLERVAVLTARGRSAEQIADELGCHKRSVTRARRRAEQHELLSHPDTERAAA